MKGTTTDQDARFPNKDKKLLKTTKFDPLLDDPVDMTKVILDTLKTWIAARVSEILGFEDEVVIDYIYEILETERPLNPHKIQIQITGFLGSKNARIFMHELWHLLKSAENNGGIPKELVELRMAELEEEKKKLKDEEIQEENTLNENNKSNKIVNKYESKNETTNKSEQFNQDDKSNNYKRSKNADIHSSDNSSDDHKRHRSNYKSYRDERKKYFTSSESPPNNNILYPKNKPIKRKSSYGKSNYSSGNAINDKSWTRDKHYDDNSSDKYHKYNDDKDFYHKKSYHSRSSYEQAHYRDKYYNSSRDKRNKYSYERSKEYYSRNNRNKYDDVRRRSKYSKSSDDKYNSSYHHRYNDISNSRERSISCSSSLSSNYDAKRSKYTNTSVKSRDIEYNRYDNKNSPKPYVKRNISPSLSESSDGSFDKLKKMAISSSKK